MSCWLNINSCPSIWWDTSSRKALGNPEFWLCVPVGQDGVKMVNKTATQNVFLFDLKHILQNHFGNWVAFGGKELWIKHTGDFVFSGC
jgi:hypothetical protein